MVPTSCVIFWKLCGESGSPPSPAPRGCLHPLVPGNFLYLWSQEGRWSPPLTFLQSPLPLTRARTRSHLQAHQVVQVHQPLSRLYISSYDHNQLFSNINSQQPYSPWPRNITYSEFPRIRMWTSWGVNLLLIHTHMMYLPAHLASDPMQLLPWKLSLCYFVLKGAHVRSYCSPPEGFHLQWYFSMLLSFSH